MPSERTDAPLAVIGAGTMGHGIAQAAAMAGFTVTLVDVDGEALDRALADIRASLETLVSKEKLAETEGEATLERLSTSTDASAAVPGAQLVVEAVPEKIELKTRIFEQLGETADEDAILATNTSSLPVTSIAAATRRPGRVVGMHFFNPVVLMPLVEIVRGERTTDATVQVAQTVAERLGKEPIVVRDSPGFASSRLGIAIALEAMRMVETGVGSVEAIDRAMELGYRHPMGPLRLSDLVGLDVRLAIAEHLHRELGARFRPPQILRRKVRAGKLGKKTGEGFYLHDED